ncbi:MAG: polysaccharide deacetylase family protein [Thermaerobacterales bacterium]
MKARPTTGILAGQPRSGGRLMITVMIVTYVVIAVTSAQGGPLTAFGLPLRTDGQNPLPSELQPHAARMASPPRPGDGPLEPNEGGQVMVLMYHSIGFPEAKWRRTPSNFRRDLQELYDQGYRLVPLTDYLRGRIDLPRGYSPVILTFDDGTRGQFNYLQMEDGSLTVDPQSAVGILLDFARLHAEFGMAATFFINWPRPFGQPALTRAKLEALRRWQGMEIGNHTDTHVNLARVDAATGRVHLAAAQASVEQILRGYRLESLALPFGAMPHDRSILLSGQAGDVQYQHRGVLLVGAQPAPSPFDRSFNPAAIPRIQADQHELYRWLDYFSRYPERRYVSDGRPGTVLVPEDTADRIDPGRVHDSGRVLRIMDRSSR